VRGGGRRNRPGQYSNAALSMGPGIFDEGSRLRLVTISHQGSRSHWGLEVAVVDCVSVDRQVVICLHGDPPLAVHRAGTAATAVFRDSATGMHVDSKLIFRRSRWCFDGKVCGRRQVVVQSTAQQCRSHQRPLHAPRPSGVPNHTNLTATAAPTNSQPPPIV
jgi:hypothetical protein